MYLVGRIIDCEPEKVGYQENNNEDLNFVRKRNYDVLKNKNDSFLSRQKFVLKLLRFLITNPIRVKKRGNLKKKLFQQNGVVHTDSTKINRPGHNIRIY